MELGALAALDIDGFDQGRQAGEIAEKILNKTPVAELPGAEARRVAVKVNWSVAKKLGVTLDGIDRLKQGLGEGSRIAYGFSLPAPVSVAGVTRSVL